MSDSLAANWQRVRARIESACFRAIRKVDDVSLIAVTKFLSIAAAETAFRIGLHHLAENRPQELWKKQAAIPQAAWHLIGHLQRNKIERTVPLCALIHSVDSPRLLEALDDFGRERNAPVPILLEVNCSREAAKGGFAPADLPALAEQLPMLSGVNVQGLMTMAAQHDDPALARPAFVECRQLRDELRRRTGLALPQLSMGMSNDFEIAIEEGATMVRLGSVLFEGLA
jgi:hypothetical protein